MSEMVLSVPWKQVHHDGIEGVVEVMSYDLPMERPLVSDLVQALNRKLRSEQVCGGPAREVRFLQLYGTRLDDGDRLLETLTPGLLYGCPRLLASTYLVAAATSCEQVICIRTLTGKTIKVKCHAANDVEEIKHCVWEQEGIPIDQQRMIFACRQLEAGRKLSDYGIENGSTLHLVLRLRGGYIAPRCFADVSDDSIMVQNEFSAAAPDWRICREGLNIEGRCKNRACAAYKQVVIHPVDFSVFNLMKDGGVKCPKCRLKVKPHTCGFYNCAWKFEGVKTSDGFFVSSPWRSASGEKYHRFEADESSGSIEWESLLIVVKPLEDAAAAGLVDYAREGGGVVCATCWTEIYAEVAVESTCGHFFHRRCVRTWALWSQGKKTLPMCPVCLRTG